MDGPEIRQLVDGATYLFTNAYEAALIEQKTGWSAGEILDRVQTRVTTYGAEGSVVQRKNEVDIHVPCAEENAKRDPTGVGDAFRAGFLTGASWGLSLRRCAEIGSLLATYVIETIGTQEYEVGESLFAKRLEQSYGPDAVADVKPHLRCPRP